MEVCIGGSIVVALARRVLLCVLAGSGDFVSLLLAGTDSTSSIAGVRARFLGGCELFLGLEAFIFFGTSDSSSEGKSKMSKAFTLGASLDAFATVVCSVSLRTIIAFLSLVAVNEGA